MAIAASNILFGKATKENLAQLDEATLNDVFANVPHYDLDKNLLGGTAVDLFNQEGMQIFPSKSEMRKLVKGGGVSLNKEKLAAFDQVVTADDLIDGKYLLVQKGKKNYFLITVKKTTTFAPVIVPWCNGSTTVFGSVSGGSNPPGTTGHK